MREGIGAFPCYWLLGWLLGCGAAATTPGLVGTVPLAVIDSFGDHRIAMAFSVAAAAFPPCKRDGVAG